MSVAAPDSMAKASDLPTEIWLLIASYLPKSQVLQLKSLNAVFFYCGMDINWSQVTIDMRYAHRAARVLSRMADPFVASRTRRLSVCFRQPKMKEETTTSSTSVQATLVTDLLNILPLLHNLTFLKIELLYIPLDLLPALFRTITTSPLARTIEKLSLGGHPDLLASLEDYPTFANLSALKINLMAREPMHNGNDRHPAVTANTPNNILSLARFILSLSPSLQRLCIRNSSRLDVSLLFSRISEPLNDSSSLIPLPNLTYLFLILPFNLSFRTSPQSIHRFLLVHSTNIQHLQLILSMNRWALESNMEGPLGTWLSNFVQANDIAHDSNDDSTTQPSHFFPNLQTLDILYPPTTSAGQLATLDFIKRTAPTLSSLIIRHCDLSCEGADQIVYALTEGGVGSTKLNSLRMDISYPDIHFLELLAYKLPQLQKLRLRVISPFPSSHLQDLFSLQIRLYILSAKDDCLSSWKLRELSIQESGYEWDNAVTALAAYVPSLVLGGGGDEDSDEE